MESVFTTQKEIKERTIVENDLAFAFPTYIPIVPGHTLICPKRVVLNVYDLKEEELLGMVELMRKLKPALEKVFNTSGFNYAWNEGEVAGQEVPHLHIHMLPRKEGDTGVLGYDPRKFFYRPGVREISPEKELKEIADLIRSNL